MKAVIFLLTIFPSSLQLDSITEFSAPGLVVLLLVQPPQPWKQLQAKSETQVQNYNICMNPW